MTDYVPDYGIDEWRAWETPCGFLLCTDELAVSVTDQFVSQMLALGNECAGAGYARWVAVNPSRVVNTTLHRVEYYLDTGSPPDFGTPAAGLPIKWMVGFLDTGDDATATIIGYWDLGSVDPDGTAFTVDVGADGLVHIAYQAP